MPVWRRYPTARLSPIVDMAKPGNRGTELVYGAILFGVLGVLTGIFGRFPALVAATCGAVSWGLINGRIAHQPIGLTGLRVLMLVVTLQAMFLVGVALRTSARR